MSTHRIALMNQKGGVGKTTSTANLGACLARLGQRVLIVDLDPQANLSVHLGIDIFNLERSLYDVLVDDMPMADVVLTDVRPGLDCLPSHIDLSGVEVELAAAVGRERVLKEALDAYLEAADPAYDYVLVDCPPSLGVLTMNAMTAVEEVIVPLQAEFFALQGMSKLIEVVDLVRRRINGRLRVTGVIACMVDLRKNLSREVVEEIQEFFGDRVFATHVRANVALAEAPSHGQTIIEYAPRSHGAQDYTALAEELVGRHGKPIRPAPTPALTDDDHHDDQDQDEIDEDPRESSEGDLRAVQGSGTQG